MGGGRRWGEEEDDGYISSEASPALREPKKRKFAPDRTEPDNTVKAHASIVVYDLHGLQPKGLRGGVYVSPRGVRPNQGGRRSVLQEAGGHEDG